MRHLDLFSGIGGFALAIDKVFHEQKNTHIFVEIDPFCIEVLKKHWPDAPIISDIRTLADTRSQEQRGLPSIIGKEMAEAWQGCFLLTGGFPCQPFSQAGRRKGTEDDRHLWPEMLRVIRATKPQWVVAENVRGLLTIGGGVVFEQVCADLEGAGYEVQPLIIPAVAVNAPHRRDRVWFIARNTEHDGLDGTENGESDTKGIHRDKTGTDSVQQSARPNLTRIFSTHSRQQHGSKGRDEGMEESATKWTSREPEPKRCGEKNPANSERTGYTRKVNQARQSSRHRRGTQSPEWNENWLEVATKFCTLDDGLPDGLPRPKGWRNAALKACGNSIVPQVAEEIFQAIKMTPLSANE